MRRSIGFAVLPTILLSPIPAISDGTSEIVNRIVRVETANPSIVLEGTLTLPGDDYNPGARASLSDIVYGLDLTEQQRIDVRPILIECERTVLQHLRSLHRTLKAAAGVGTV